MHSLSLRLLCGLKQVKTMAPGWIGKWFLFFLWLSGYWFALASMCSMVAILMLPRSLPVWIPFGVGCAVAFIVTLIYILSYAPFRFRQLQAFYRMQALKDTKSADLESQNWADAFIGMLAGPALMLGLFALAQEVGQPSDFSLERYNTSLVGQALTSAWLGSVTWVVIGMWVLAPGILFLRNASLICLKGGIAALVGIGLLFVVLHWSRVNNPASEPFAGNLYILAGPLMWAVILTVVGIHLQRLRQDETGSRGWIPQPPRDFPGDDYGASVPARVPPNLPVRSARAAKEVPLEK